MLRIVRFDKLFRVIERKRVYLFVCFLSVLIISPLFKINAEDETSRFMTRGQIVIDLELALNGCVAVSANAGMEKIALVRSCNFG